MKVNIDEMKRMLELEDMMVDYHAKGGLHRAVDGVSLTIHEGEAVALVGESGSGKTTLVLAALGLLSGVRQRGFARIGGKDMLGMSREQRRRVMGREVGLVLQDPYASFDPVQHIGTQIAQVLGAHFRLTRAQIRQRVHEELEAVELNADRVARLYPHELSGGMLQRAQLAMALCCGPKLLVADEPTSALDVVVQAQIIDVLTRLRRERSLALLIITHDLGVVAALADTVAVMRAGKVVEYGSVSQVLTEPSHAYTRALVKDDGAYRWQVGVGV